jgi:23S rRNA (guanine745-N1)-methyltransferase
VLDPVVDLLACPACAGRLQTSAGTLRCDRGHSFDVARQGYVSLLAAGAEVGAGDTAEMVDARARFLAAGHFAPLVAALADRAAAAAPASPVIADIGAGPGTYLAAVVDRLPGAHGVTLDLSRAAGKRAARVHPRVGAVVADGRLPLPLRSGAFDLALSVFAPRNAPELQRILRPQGTLLVVTPSDRHLNPMVARLQLLTVDPDKARRLDQQLGPHFEQIDQTPCEFPLSLPHAHLEQLVLMGPSAFHADPITLRARIAALPAPVAVTASVTITAYRPRPPGT